MNRRVFLASVSASAIAAALCVGISFAATTTTSSTSTTRLNAATMKAALRTVTADQNAFIDSVLALVHVGKLKPDLVDSTFQWARKKPKNQFEYFQNALITRCTKQGIDLTALIKSLSTSST